MLGSSIISDKVFRLLTTPNFTLNTFILFKLLLISYRIISSLSKLDSGFTQACNVRESFKVLCKLFTPTAVCLGILKEVPKFKVVPVGVAEIKTFLTGLPALKLTLPVMIPVGFLNPMPVIKEE